MSVDSNDTPKTEEAGQAQSEESAKQDSAETQEVSAEPAEEFLSEEEQLRRQLQEAQARADENWEQLLRARAEVDNTRKRAERDVSQARKYGLESIARDLLPIHDSLVLGLADVEKEDASLETAREGLRLINQMLDKLMEQYAIEVIDPEGETFDPEKHQAVSVQESAERPPNTVMQVIQKGYRLNERVLRPAMVIVARAPEPTGSGDEAEDS